MIVAVVDWAKERADESIIGQEKNVMKGPRYSICGR